MTTEPTIERSRLVSLDALRGFDMCWILGLAGLLEHLLNALHVPGRKAIIDQMEHVDWAGFHFLDLIFPLFLFISGVSLAIVIPRRLASEGRSATARKLVLRAAVLFMLGVIYSGGLENGIEKVRWLGVLQRIALGSCGAGLLSMWLSPRGLVAALIALLVGYWALLTFVPVPGIGAGNYAEGMNLTNYLDRVFLMGHKYDGDHDPEGILSTLPAIATGLLGILAGRWITGASSPSRKTWSLIAAGLLLLIAGWVWHLQFPVIKKLWTSSFVLVAGGWSAILLGVFYGIIEVAGWKAWTKPFVWVGANPIMMYLCSDFGFFSIVGSRLTGPMHGEWSWVPALVNFLLMLATARYLFRRGIYLRV